MVKVHYLLNVEHEKLRVEIFLGRKYRIYHRIFTPCKRLKIRLVRWICSAEKKTSPQKAAGNLKRLVRGGVKWLQKATVEYPFLYNLLTLTPGKKRLRFIILFSRAGHCRSLQWQTVLGLNDAAGTAVAAGILWPVKLYLLHKFLHKAGEAYVLDNAPRIEIKPAFNKLMLESHLEGIFRIRAGYIILNMFINLFHGLLPDFSTRRGKFYYVKKTGGIDDGTTNASH